VNAHLRYWKSVVQAAEAELDAATTNSELKLAARRLLRAREYLKSLATKRPRRRPPTIPGTAKQSIGQLRARRRTRDRCS
jgi:hypothetical protein